MNGRNEILIFLISTKFKQILFIISLLAKPKQLHIEVVFYYNFVSTVQNVANINNIGYTLFC